MGSVGIAYRRTPEKRLNDREERFVNEYVKEQNGSQSAIAAGYSKKRASVTAAELLKKPHISAAIGVLQRKMREECQIEAYEIIEHLHYAYLLDPSVLLDKSGKPLPLHKIPKQARACIERIERDKNGKIIGYTLMSKERLLDTAMKHKGLFAPQEMNVNRHFDFDCLIRQADTPDPIEQRLLAEQNGGKLIETTAMIPTRKENGHVGNGHV